MAKSSIVLLLLSLFALSAYADVFVSIDCGSSDKYTDENSIKWTGDDNLVQTGQSEVVDSSYDVPNLMSTLRVFNSGKKNCYSIDAEKGRPIRVRASFLYGNYDKKFAPPMFDLYFDGNFWDTVQTSIVSTPLVFEVLYVAKGDTTSVCLVQTQPGQFPLISALEVRSLGPDMYDLDGSNHALFLKRRNAFGANSIIRYPDDEYDRPWRPSSGATGYVVVTSDATSIDTSKGNKPPEAAVRNAITSIFGNPITLSEVTFPSKEMPIYAVLYFSEVEELDSTQKRSFVLYKDEKAISGPITPPYGSVYQLPVSTTASSKTRFYLVATSDSTLSPLLNALELFYVSDPLTGGTDSKDGKSSDTKSKSSVGDTPSGSSKKSSKLPVIIGSVAAVLIAVVAVVGFLAIWHHKRKTAAVAAAAATTVNGGGFYGTAQAQGAQASNAMFSKTGEVMINEIKVNMQDQTANEINHEFHHQDQHANHDERNYT